MSTNRTCEHQTLARNGTAHIQRCAECGCVSVHLGPMTVRIDEAGLEALWAVFGEAITQLHVRRAIATQVETARGLA